MRTYNHMSAFAQMIWMGAKISVSLHQQKTRIHRQGQRGIRRASHGCLSIVIDRQH